MAFTEINSEDQLVQKTFAENLRDKVGWKIVHTWNQETLGSEGRVAGLIRASWCCCANCAPHLMSGEIAV